MLLNAILSPTSITRVNHNLLTSVRRLLRILFWLFIVSATIATPVVSAAELKFRLNRDASAISADTDPKYAIVVGVNQYRDRGSQLAPLLYAANDARLLSATFRKQGYTVVELLDFAADRDHILDVISTIRAPENDTKGTIVFAFSGHGFQQDGINFLAMGNTDITRPSTTALSIKQLKLAMAQTGYAQRVLFIDACRTGSGRDVPGIDRRFALDNSASGTAVMYSTAAGELAYENNQLMHGVFSHFLAQSLQGAAANKNGVVTFNGVFDFVQQRVRKFVLEQFNRSQIPYIAGERNGDFTLMTDIHRLSTGQQPLQEQEKRQNYGGDSSPSIRSSRWRNIGIAVGVAVVGAIVANSDSSSAAKSSEGGSITLILPTP